MDFLQPIIPLISTIIGGVLVYFGERLRSRNESKLKRAENVVSLYTDFFVTFQEALHRNESWWSSVADAEVGHGSSPGVEERNECFAAEKAFREAAWRLVIRERNREQQDRIKAISRAFDYDSATDDATVAQEYSKTVQELRIHAGAVVNHMQKIHGKTIDLI